MLFLLVLHAYNVWFLVVFLYSVNVLLRKNNREKTGANNVLFESQNAAFSSEHIVRNVSNCPSL